MNCEEKKRPYVAIVLNRSSSDAEGYKELWEEAISLVFAGSEEEARAKATKRALSQQTAYANERGETITWTFERLVDVAEALEDELDADVDLYARHFRDFEAYASFDPLLNGEPL